ncbi:MAG: ABC transporter permease [Tissierellia bacterium]|nr:ABC transporter permease [Tissierellia bacterium]
MNKKVILERILSFIITLILSTIILFVLIRLAPGDPVKIFLGTPETSDVSKTNYQERYDALVKELNLDKPIPNQYIAWMKKAVKFDFGNSIYSKQPVVDELKSKLPATLLLTIPAIILQLIVGLSLGIISAINHNKLSDNLIRLFCAFIASIPGFALSLILIYLFAVKLGSYEISPSTSLTRLWLPALTLGVISSPGIIRVVRTSILEELGKPYVGFLISMGAKKIRIIKNVLLNIILPVIAISSTTFANLIGGSVVIENVFSWPGIGKYAMDSILKRDYPIIQGYGFLMVCFVILINVLVDVIYMSFDPTIKSMRLKTNENKNEI